MNRAPSSIAKCIGLLVCGTSDSWWRTRQTGLALLCNTHLGEHKRAVYRYHALQTHVCLEHLVFGGLSIYRFSPTGVGEATETCSPWKEKYASPLLNMDQEDIGIKQAGVITLLCPP
jgi:hypothetical protein